MDFKDYKNKLEYPRKEDFTTTYYYRHGECMATVRPGEATPDIAPGAVKEKVVNEEAFAIARQEYQKHDVALRNMFIVDILQDFGLPDNEFTRALYNVAYQQGHSNGYSDIYNCFSELADLDSIAKKVYRK